MVNSVPLDQILTTLANVDPLSLLAAAITFAVALWLGAQLLTAVFLGASCGVITQAALLNGGPSDSPGGGSAEWFSNNDFEFTFYKRVEHVGGDKEYVGGDKRMDG